jgi:hypothetical protein
MANAWCSHMPSLDSFVCAGIPITWELRLGHAANGSMTIAGVGSSEVGPSKRDEWRHHGPLWNLNGGTGSVLAYGCFLLDITGTSRAVHVGLNLAFDEQWKFCGSRLTSFFYRHTDDYYGSCECPWCLSVIFVLSILLQSKGVTIIYWHTDV